MKRQNTAPAAWVLVCLGLFIIFAAIMLIGGGHSARAADPYAGCTIVSKEKTGKTRPDVAMKFVGRQYETIRTWKCANGEKLQVVWEQW